MIKLFFIVLTLTFLFFPAPTCHKNEQDPIIKEVVRCASWAPLIGPLDAPQIGSFIYVLFIDQIIAFIIPPALVITSLVVLGVKFLIYPQTKGNILPRILILWISISILLYYAYFLWAKLHPLVK